MSSSSLVSSMSLPALVERGADASLIHSKIIASATWNDHEIVTIPRDMNEKDERGRTALDIAMEKGNQAMMKLLSKYGVKPGSKGPCGDRAIVEVWSEVSPPDS